jgi:hypothetical protein
VTLSLHDEKETVEGRKMEVEKGRRRRRECCEVTVIKEWSL